jgi:glycosyltransferase involved in cell wall biosynthesis
MKIGIVCCEYPPGPHGGIGSLTQVIARGLVRRGHELRVVGTYARSYPAPDFETDEGVVVWRLRSPDARLGYLAARWQLYLRLSRWAASRAVDVIEVPDYEGMLGGFPRLGVPVVARLNGSATYFARELGRTVRRGQRWLERWTLARADAWCSASAYTLQATRDLFPPPRLTRVIYNPVQNDTGASGLQARARDTVVYSGTLTAKKGVVSLIDAWPRVALEHPDATLHIYGKDGAAPDGGSMQAFLAAKLSPDVRASVHFHGHVDRSLLLESLRRARVAIFPSYAEAFAMAPLEAMAAGCPTIATTRGSGPELLRHESEGLLVDPDEPPGIADAILRLLNDDLLARRLGEAGRARVERDFTADVLLPQNEQLYAECVARFRA